MREINWNRIAGRLREAAPGAAVLEEEPLCKHTTFQTGGPAAVFAEPENAGQLAGCLAVCREEDVPCTILGRGSNVLAADGGWRGVVLRIGDAMGGMTREDDRIEAGAGVTLAALAHFVKTCGLAGLEFAAGIPGSLGGALSMNAGAYGGEMKDVTVRVKGIRPDGSPVDLTGEEMRFGYRRSAVTELGFVVTEVTLELQPGDPAAIRARMAELNAMRAEKQPLDVPSAGSTFKRPEGYFAAALIDQCGLKGYSVGGAQVSQKHAGFLVNTGSSSGDYLELVRTVQRIVQERAGVLLEPEIKIIGEQGEA